MIKVIVYSLLFFILLTLSIIDYHTMRIPNRLIIFGLLLGSLYRLGSALYYKDLGIIFKGIIGMLLGGAIIGGMILVSLLLFKEEGMGMGDLKLLAMIGLFVGGQYVVCTIVAALLLGGLYGLVKFKVRGKISFGPFISAGAVIAILWGDSLVASYLKII